jgi:hypothetical protein
MALGSLRPCGRVTLLLGLVLLAHGADNATNHTLMCPGSSTNQSHSPCSSPLPQLQACIALDAASPASGTEEMQRRCNVFVQPASQPPPEPPAQEEAQPAADDQAPPGGGGDAPPPELHHNFALEKDGGCTHSCLHVYSIRINFYFLERTTMLGCRLWAADTASPARAARPSARPPARCRRQGPRLQPRRQARGRRPGRRLGHLHAQRLPGRQVAGAGTEPGGAREPCRGRAVRALLCPRARPRTARPAVAPAHRRRGGGPGAERHGLAPAGQLHRGEGQGRAGVCGGAAAVGALSASALRLALRLRARVRCQRAVRVW